MASLLSGVSTPTWVIAFRRRSVVPSPQMVFSFSGAPTPTWVIAIRSRSAVQNFAGVDSVMNTEPEEKTSESSMYQPPCPGKNSWPELVGKDGKSAKKTIEKENENVEAIVLLVGTPVTRDIRCDRVWVWVDESGVVVRTPIAG